METGIKNIYRVCKYRTATAGNYIWRYKINNDYDLKIDITFLNNLRHIGKPINKPVIQYDMDFNFIKRFNSIKEAEELTGCSKSKIVRVCQGFSSHTKKYKWKYE